MSLVYEPFATFGEVDYDNVVDRYSLAKSGRSTNSMMCPTCQPGGEGGAFDSNCGYSVLSIDSTRGVDIVDVRSFVMKMEDNNNRRGMDSIRKLQGCCRN